MRLLADHVGAGQDLDAAHLGRGIGQRDPGGDLLGRIEAEISAVLVPGDVRPLVRLLQPGGEVVDQDVRPDQAFHRRAAGRTCRPARARTFRGSPGSAAPPRRSGNRAGRGSRHADTQRPGRAPDWWMTDWWMTDRWTTDWRTWGGPPVGCRSVAASRTLAAPRTLGNSRRCQTTVSDDDEQPDEEAPYRGADHDAEHHAARGIEVVPAPRSALCGTLSRATVFCPCIMDTCIGPILLAGWIMGAQ